MKKNIMAMIAASAMFNVFDGAAEETSREKISVEPAKILIVYYSKTGNTREMAKQIQKTTGGNIFEIQVVKPYSDDYQTLVDQAKKEINAGFKPELKAKVKDIGKYDVIFVGSPNWWSTIAPPVATFLTSYDFSGKTIIPFVTHGGGGMARCERDVQKLCPKSSFAKGLALSGSSVKYAQDKVNKWLREIKIIK
jgi:flavodoxin